MKQVLWLATATLSFLILACSSVPEPEKEPFSQLLDQAIDAPSGDGVIDKAMEDAATTFPKTKPVSSGSSTTPPPPRTH